jgi:predicted alpha/beta-hydrolase family hydrolase
VASRTVTQLVTFSTSVGPARWHLDAAAGRGRALLALGHGAGGGVEAHDLQLLARWLPGLGVTVARFEQPWRLAGRPVAGPPRQLDAAWSEALSAVRAQVPDAPVVVGGRSAGARVACRTAAPLGAAGVLSLAFPLHPPGRADRTRAAELTTDLPLLVVQGTRDTFGTAEEVKGALGPGSGEVEAITGADHALRVTRTGPLTQGEADELIFLAARRWLTRLVGSPLF